MGGECCQYDFLNAVVFRVVGGRDLNEPSPLNAEDNGDKWVKDE